MHRKLGLIGGLAFRAGVFYYEQIQRRFAATGQPLRLMVNHADVARVLPLVASGDRTGLGGYLGGLANELADAGCEIVAITAVAPHLAIAEIAAVARVSIANVLETIPEGLAAAGIDRVAVFGNRAVMLTDVFGAVQERNAVRLDPQTVEWVHATYNAIALKGKRATQPETTDLGTLAHRLIREADVQAIVLAGTDLSSFYAEQKPDFPFVDVAQLHIDGIVRLCTG